MGSGVKRFVGTPVPQGVFACEPRPFSIEAPPHCHTVLYFVAALSACFFGFTSMLGRVLSGSSYSASSGVSS